MQEQLAVAAQHVQPHRLVLQALLEHVVNGKHWTGVRAARVDRFRPRKRVWVSRPRDRLVLARTPATAHRGKSALHAG